LKINSPRFKPAEFLRTIWYAKPESGTTVKDMLKPDYWTHVSFSLKQGDRIEAIAEDGSWFAEFYVKYANKVETHVALMRDVTLGKPAAKKETAEPEHLIKYVNQNAKWRITRTKDKVMLVEKLESKEVAQEWLNKYLEDIAA